MFEKIWDDHVVHAEPGKQTILYIDLQLVHEVTSAQAFEGLRLAGRKVRRPERTVATVDHNVPTTDRSLPIVDPISKKQIDTLRHNCREFGIRLYDIHDANQGVVHVIGPELGYTQPGMTIVCGDSHTATHGAFGALAFGIGTSEVEHVLATQTLLQYKPKTLEVRVDGRLHARRDRQGPDPLPDRPALDQRRRRLLHRVHRRGDPRPEHGRADDRLQHDDRGRRPGRTDRPRRKDVRLSARPAVCAQGFRRGRAPLAAVADRSGAKFDRIETFDAGRRAAASHLGHHPGPSDRRRRPRARSGRLRRSDRTQGRGRGAGVHGPEARHADHVDPDRSACSSARAPTGGSKTCGPRRPWFAAIAWPTASHAMVVPGSGLVKRQAEAEGLDAIFREAGLEWREAGCSMCLAMNPDKLEPGERCAATSNRNFEGRQGKGGRTHLVSPAMAAAAAVAGHFVDVREWDLR